MLRQGGIRGGWGGGEGTGGGDSLIHILIKKFEHGRT